MERLLIIIIGAALAALWLAGPAAGQEPAAAPAAGLAAPGAAGPIAQQEPFPTIPMPSPPPTPEPLPTAPPQPTVEPAGQLFLPLLDR